MDYNRFDFLNEIEIAMEYNPTLSIVDLLYMVCNTVQPASMPGNNMDNTKSGWPRSNQFYFDCLTKYNSNKKTDKCRLKEFEKSY